MRYFKNRLSALERKQQGKAYEVASPDGRITATITPLGDGRPPSAVIWYNSLHVEAEEAEILIRPYLPRELHSLFIFPQDLTVEQWQTKYSPQRKVG